jgi:hypothetical protein
MIETWIEKRWRFRRGVVGVEAVQRPEPIVSRVTRGQYDVEDTSMRDLIDVDMNDSLQGCFPA